MNIWINLGRLLMLGIWSFLILNLIHPFPRPLNIFMVLAMGFMLLMHGVQFLLLKASQPKDAPALSGMLQLRIFLFGVFELLDWQRKQPATPRKPR
ncbi:Putative inner membrane protein [Dickeya aquatica]|uniref:Inner membrane protein n=1 Tax=Dickeya aquatica TaxID=1401087 RepID=A0A375A5A1_9GAMM|nr:Putative inner membrane protein [Dickeya aquatica]